MKLIVAVDKEWGIGLDDQLLYRIPNDMEFFKKTTKGKVVIMGRKTFDSLPNRQPLSNRLNIILSSQKIECKENMLVFKTLGDMFDYIKDMNADDVYVIGGEQIYRALLDYCSEALVTKIYSVSDKNKYFPNLDDLDNWVQIEESAEFKHKDISYRFTKYLNKTAKKAN